VHLAALHRSRADGCAAPDISYYGARLTQSKRLFSSDDHLLVREQEALEAAKRMAK